VGTNSLLEESVVAVGNQGSREWTKWDAVRYGNERYHHQNQDSEPR
jgi:hypothetical protein